MSDFDLAKLPDLLARLDGPAPMDISAASGGRLVPDAGAIRTERDEAAAAIRALEAREKAVEAERDACAKALEVRGKAVEAERDACAKACDRVAAEFFRHAKRSRKPEDFIEKYSGALACYDAIRARGIGQGEG